MTTLGWGAKGLVAVLVSAAAVVGQTPEPTLDADLVRRALAGTSDEAAWSALEGEAMAAAEGPFVLRQLRFEGEGSELLLELAGYGLPTLEQVMKPGAPTRVVVSLPGARSAVPHGFELADPRGFQEVRVRQAPHGVEVEALLPAGTAAVIDEAADGVRIRPVTPAAAVAQEGSGTEIATVAVWAVQQWVEALRLGRPLAIFPLVGAGALSLLLLSWIWARGRNAASGWSGATDARRLADRLSASASADA
ncbi:hypothetical protein WI460_15530 [Gemmatimonadota bacterium Y43]|uniref:hypothetical protein n=1 Tax=Gaopeijia maritima TaxID=3119007 RepID=UPI003272AB7C